MTTLTRHLPANVSIGELQLSTYEYPLLEDRFRMLERQHRELQDLASAYSEVIRGFSPAASQSIGIDQLQVEAGCEGLRAKALKMDMLRPFLQEAGGLQALVLQFHTMRTLIDKAGGLGELEQFVSDLGSIRDTLDKIRGTQGLDGLALEVKDLLMSHQEHAELRSQVDGPNGLRAKAVRYEKLRQAFAEIPTNTTTHTIHNAPPLTYVRPIEQIESTAVPSSMNPARARLISATPLEVDPDRDLYEAAPLVSVPCKKTGSNNTPFGLPQGQTIAPLMDQDRCSSTLKRKGNGDSTANIPAKRLRVDICGPVHLAINSPSDPLSLNLTTSGNGRAKQAVSGTESISVGPRYPGLSAWKDFIKYSVALWIGAYDTTTAWDAYQSCGLKKDSQISDDLLTLLLGQLVKHTRTTGYSTYETMTPNRDTCILR
jgi:hypothetical protein